MSILWSRTRKYSFNLDKAKATKSNSILEIEAWTNPQRPHIICPIFKSGFCVNTNSNSVSRNENIRSKSWFFGKSQIMFSFRICGKCRFESCIRKWKYSFKIRISILLVQIRLANAGCIWIRNIFQFVISKSGFVRITQETQKNKKK